MISRVFRVEGTRYLSLAVIMLLLSARGDLKREQGWYRGMVIKPFHPLTNDWSMRDEKAFLYLILLRRLKSDGAGSCLNRRSENKA